MRRKDRQVLDSEKIDNIIFSCHCCRLGFIDDNNVYIVPLNFGYENIDKKRIFYFHSSAEGKKIRLIKNQKSVGFELDTNYQLNEAKTACEYSAKFQSVIGIGNIFLIESFEEKIYALKQIMFHNTGKHQWDFPAEVIKKMAIFKLEVVSLSCKEHKENYKISLAV